MATVEQHERKYRSNNTLLNIIGDIGYYDWQVTVLYYAVLHKVRASLILIDVDIMDYANNQGKITHCSMIRAVSDHIDENIGTDYRTLLELSYKARYQAEHRVRIATRDIAKELANGIEAACDKVVAEHKAVEVAEPTSETTTALSN